MGTPFACAVGILLLTFFNDNKLTVFIVDNLPEIVFKEKGEASNLF